METSVITNIGVGETLGSDVETPFHLCQLWSYSTHGNTRAMLDIGVGYNLAVMWFDYRYMIVAWVNFGMLQPQTSGATVDQPVASHI